MEIELSSSFLRRARKLEKKEKRLLSDRIEIFRKDPNDSRLKTHFLTGKLKGLLAFSVTYTKRAVFMYIDGKALFVDVGSHEEVYK